MNTHNTHNTHNRIIGLVNCAFLLKDISTDFKVLMLSDDDKYRRYEHKIRITNNISDIIDNCQTIFLDKADKSINTFLHDHHLVFVNCDIALQTLRDWYPNARYICKLKCISGYYYLFGDTGKLGKIIKFYEILTDNISKL